MERAAPGVSIGVRLAVLGASSAAVDLGSVLLKSRLGPPGITLGDWIESVGTFAVLAAYAWVVMGLLREPHGPGARRIETGAAPVLLAVSAAFAVYAFGRGIHLASNSLHDLLGPGSRRELLALADLWDERVGHVLIDAARATLAVALTALEGLGTPGEPGGSPAARSRVGRIALAVGAAAYGFIYFATGVEGQTVALALPFSLAYAAWGIARSRRRRLGVVGKFFTAAALVSLLFFAIWGLWQGGFPEFTRSGIL